MSRARWLLVAIVLAVLLIAPSASAQVDILVGVGYNTYSIDWGPDSEPFNSGMGASAGARYWLTDAVAVHGGIDYLSGSGSETIPGEDLDDDGIPDLPETKTAIGMTSIGYVGGVALRIRAGDSFSLTPFASVGSYGGTIDSTATTTDPLLGSSSVTLSVATERVIGYQAGIEAGYDIDDSLRLTASAAYRSLVFTRGTFEFLGVEVTQELDPHIDLSGARLQAGFSYAF